MSCAAICFISTELAAQEVRGVETKVVEYIGSAYYVRNNNSGSGECHTEWFGYSFYNMNSIPVSVDAELYIDDKLVDTKSFVLAAKEAYIWKQEERCAIRSSNALVNFEECLYQAYSFVLYDYGRYSRIYYTRKKSCIGLLECVSISSRDEKVKTDPLNQYVKYKAYKLE